MGSDGEDENCRVFAVEAGDGELRGSGFRTGGRRRSSGDCCVKVVAANEREKK